MKYKIKPINLQELGQRQNQEDSLFPALRQSTERDRLFILCDGMGGHEKGEVASATVCQTMSEFILERWAQDQPLSDQLLRDAINAAYDALDARDNGEAKKMGTTMTFLCFHSEGVTVAHIGDSRVYQLRPATKKEPARIVFKTRDHSLVNDLVAIGEITEEEALNHPQKNVITRAMQPGQDQRAKADIKHLTDIQDGDYFYMCSDGMLEDTSDNNLLFMVTKPGVSDTEKVEMLRNVTIDNKDNHTAHLIRVERVEGAMRPATPPVFSATSSPSTTRRNTPTSGTWVTPTDNKSDKVKQALRLTAMAVIVIFAIIGLWKCCFSDDDNEDNNQPLKEQVEQQNDNKNNHHSAKPQDNKSNDQKHPDKTEDEENAENVDGNINNEDADDDSSSSFWDIFIKNK